MALAAGSNLGPYRIVEQVGRGGMATVYKAFQPSLKRFVAIKVLPDFLAEDQGFRSRFEQEAIAVASLRHSNILTVFDHGEADGVAYIVTEFVDGGTLADQLGKAQSTDYTERILGPIASALDYAHSRGVLHRDLKPSNILLAQDGTPVLSDFGLALMMTTSQMRLTQTGTILGTPEYMSPEQCEGDVITPAADIYSLGVVAYEMLTGRVPFTAATPAAVLIAQIQSRLPPPRQINPNLSATIEAALLKALAKNPADRFRTASDFVRALISEPATAAAVRSQPAPAGLGWSAFTFLANRLVALVMAIIVLIVVVGGSLVLYPGLYRPAANQSHGPPSSPSPSPSPIARGQLVFQAKLDGTGSDLNNVYQNPDQSAARIDFARGAIVFSILKPGGGTGGDVNFAPLARYIAEIDLSVPQVSNVDCWWIIRSGDLSTGAVLIDIDTNGEKIRLEYWQGSSSGPVPPAPISSDVLLPELRSNKSYTLTALVDPPRYTIFVNQFQVIDTHVAPHLDLSTTGFECQNGFRNGTGSVTVNGMRLYMPPT